jgi:hypothetical protein
LKKINLKRKIALYRRKKWHEDIVSAYDLYTKNGDQEAKNKIINHYKNKKIIWENEELLNDLKREEEKLNALIDSKIKDKTLDKIFLDYSSAQKINKTFEKKEIKIGKIVTNYLVKKILYQKKIKLTDFSITAEIIILEKLIGDDFVDIHTNKIIQKPISLDKIKQKIKNIKNNRNNFYLFLEEYLSFIFKTKKIEIDDFKKRKLILLLIDRKRINHMKYDL